MKKILFISLLLISVNYSIYASAKTITTITPLQPPAAYGNYPNCSYDSYPKVGQLEQTIFNTTFANEDIYSRLNRIETKIFRRTNSNIDLSQRVDVITQAIEPSAMYNIPLDNLARIEYKLFNRSYVNDDVETRIIRLEKEMLGAMQQGELDERYQVIAEASKHYNAFPPDNYIGNQPFQSFSSNSRPYQSYQNQYLASNNFGAQKGIFRNLISALTGGVLGGGTLTGFTPPITDPYGSYCSAPYMNNMNNSYAPNNWMQNLFPGSSSGFNDAMQTNTGYSNFTKNTGSGSGVHVLYD